MPESTPETAEEYLTLPDDRKQQAKAFIGADRKFQGKKLYPFTEGVRLVMDDINVGAIGNQRYYLTLMFILIDLQESYDAARKANDRLTEEEAAEIAFAALSEEIGDDAHRYKGKVSVRAGKMNKTAGEEARAVGFAIWKEWKDSELVPADQKKTTATNPPESAPEVPPSS